MNLSSMTQPIYTGCNLVLHNLSLTSINDSFLHSFHGYICWLPVMESVGDAGADEL